MHRLLVLVLLSGCITSSQAHLSLYGTDFEYDSPGYFRVTAVGKLQDWQEIAFEAQPAAVARGTGFEATIDATPAPIRTGPIEVGQTMTLCATAGTPSLTLLIDGKRTTFQARMSAC